MADAAARYLRAARPVVLLAGSVDDAGCGRRVGPFIDGDHPVRQRLLPRRTSGVSAGAGGAWRTGQPFLSRPADRAGRHAGACVQHHDHGNRSDFVFEQHDLLGFVLVQNDEVLLNQVGYQSAILVGGGDIQVDDLGARPKNRGLRLLRGRDDPAVRISMFADDLAIVGQGITVEECEEKVQSATNKLQNWAHKWKMKISFEKTEQLLFSLNVAEVNGKRHPNVHLQLPN